MELNVSNISTEVSLNKYEKFTCQIEDPQLGTTWFIRIYNDGRLEINKDIMRPVDKLAEEFLKMVADHYYVPTVHELVNSDRDNGRKLAIKSMDKLNELDDKHILPRDDYVELFNNLWGIYDNFDYGDIIWLPCIGHWLPHPELHDNQRCLILACWSVKEQKFLNPRMGEYKNGEFYDDHGQLLTPESCGIKVTHWTPALENPKSSDEDYNIDKESD